MNMDDRESSVASSTDFYGEDGNRPRSPRSPAPTHNSLPITVKRKADDLEPSPDKKRKLLDASPPALGSGAAASSLTAEVKPCRRLPPAVWQHVFLSCSLADLGRLLQVNRSFHSYLSDVHNVPSSKPESGCLRLLKSDSIWASARNALPVKPPKPLPGLSEARMWQLVWSKRCQFCNKLNSFAPGDKIWQKGPGPNGVRTIWPFGIKACGSCLLEQCQTDASLLFSTASALRPALPFAFITNDQHYIPAYTLQAAITPAGVDIVKYYFKQHVDDITKELNDTLRLGSAAAEEWSKGLEARGHERVKAAENWERWEVRYQWWEDHQDPKPAAPSPPPTTAAPASHKEPSKSPTRQIASPIIHAPVPASKCTSTVSIAAKYGSLLRRLSNTPPVFSLTPAAIAPQFVHPRPSTIPPQAFTPQPPAPTGSTQPIHKNLHDANEVKANRKADIERRCQQMDPSIPPNILRHMDSFKAALQIFRPMTEDDWIVLQPRLLAQLPAAQQAEADHVSRVATLATRTADRRPDVNSKEAKEVMDREWEESQRVVRDKLSAIADEFINETWDNGKSVTFENSPKFAVDLLVHVRGRYYDAVAREEGAPSGRPDITSTDGTDANKKPHLVLENMKWVYDNKLKPLTEQYRKELFLCYGSGCEGNTKYYGFEGVIQHYGAKHTNAFSVGNVVVAWREAEWPEDTPFHPDPMSVKHAHYLSSSAAGPSGYGWYSRAGTATPHMQPHLPQASPGPYQYAGHFGPFAPPQAPPNAYDYSNPSYGASMEPYQYPSMGPPGYGYQGNTNNYMTSPAITNAAIAPAPPVPPQVSGPATDTSAQSVPATDAAHSNNLFDKQVSTIIEFAQEIWKQTSGIKDMPNSLRIYVLLQRVISKFHVEFNHEPNLNHFVDAFSNHKIPKNLKNAPGLACKACQDELSHQPSGIYSNHPEGRRTYTVLNLFSHFKSQHIASHPSGFAGGQPPTHRDWKEDMIELPSDRFISGLIHAPGMDDDKLHIIATVFPRLFPTPLPRIGVVDNNGAASPTDSLPKDPKDPPATNDAPGATTEKPGPSSLGSPKPNEDEYDPLRPALPVQANQASRPLNRHPSFHGSPPPERRPRYYAEPRYYMPRDLDDEYSRPREYIEYAGSPRRIREPTYEEYPGRRPIFREHEQFYSPVSGELVYARPREGDHIQEYGAYPRQVRYIDDDERRPEFRYVEDQRLREESQSRGKTAADRFLEEFLPGQPSNSSEASGPQPAASQTEAKPPSQEAADPEDGSRYTPAPPNGVPPEDSLDPHRTLGPKHPTAPSTVSNGSRYEEYRPSGSRQIPTPESAGPQRRPGPHRRRDRYHHDHHHMPSSRYYRYMSVARDDPYGRSASMNRSQSRRYERYEEQRRRIDQQETPQPNADRDYDPAYSRDQSVDQPPPDDGYYPPFRHQPREYVSVQDRRQFSPPRYRYAGHPEDSRGPGPVYVDEYGQPVHEYEIIRVQRDHRPPRGQYFGHPQSTRYLEPEPEHMYVPVAFDRPPPQRYDGRPGEYYVYEEERHRLPPTARRPAFEPESEAFEPPPPEIKVENTPVPIAEGP